MDGCSTGYARVLNVNYSITGSLKLEYPIGSLKPLCSKSIMYLILVRTLGSKECARVWNLKLHLIYRRSESNRMRCSSPSFFLPIQVDVDAVKKLGTKIIMLGPL